MPPGCEPQFGAWRRREAAATSDQIDEDEAELEISVGRPAGVHASAPGVRCCDPAGYAFGAIRQREERGRDCFLGSAWSILLQGEPDSVAFLLSLQEGS